MSKRRGQQASRIRPAPDNLHRYINMANMLPAPEKLPGAIEGDCRDHYWDRKGDVEALVAQFKPFRGYLNGADLQAELPIEAVLRCNALSAIRALLRTIARTEPSNSATENLLAGSYLEDFVSAHPDQDGNFRVKHHPLLGALEGVELARIRECPICSKIFWAGRIDKHCCTTKCAKIQRTRRWRERYPERYKQQRYEKTQALPGKGHEAQDGCERMRLEAIRVPTIARRPARLPVLRTGKAIP